MRVITMWLAVDESKVENGCMRVISGSHNLHDRRYEAVNRENNLFGRKSLRQTLIYQKRLTLSWKWVSAIFTMHGQSTIPVPMSHKNDVRLHNALYASQCSFSRGSVGVLHIKSICCKARIGQMALIHTMLCQNFNTSRKENLCVRILTYIATSA